ncbi:hypothetical protein [Tetragenococcus halophilus]|uniref:hypothetical protein n=1 Tax=Tetragenococcus halophilus TaxID=51669 RepID=UPI0034A31B1E
MNWMEVFKDINSWMLESNKKMQQYTIHSDKYWEWLISSLGAIEAKYKHHPLVVGFLSEIIEFQDQNVQKMQGRGS